MKKKPTVGSPFFRAFPSDLIPKVMKDVNVYIFDVVCAVHRIAIYTFYISLFTAIPVNYNSEFLEGFESTTYMISVSFHLFKPYAMLHTSVH